MNRNDIAIESFIEYCDNMLVAEEGVKDVITGAAGKVKAGAKAAGEKVKQFIRFLRDLIKRVIARIKGIKTETQVDSDKYFYLTKINKVRLAAITKAEKALVKANKKDGQDAKEIADVRIEMGKVTKTEQVWKQQIKNRKAKKIPIKPDAISSILDQNKSYLDRFEGILTKIEDAYGTEAVPTSAYQITSTAIGLVKKTISEATSLLGIVEEKTDK